MIKTKAHIKLFESGRKTPFESGYRPLFSFTEKMKASGSITLIEKDEFHPGDEGEVEIVFISKKYLGASFGKGSKFLFSEGGPPLGEGEIIQVENI
ncbi:hypothetical protein [Phaeodactylibacter xiamenensis]|uniref:hypothetical protein n=1 Tax=Phaeodactylibacter xiamenensis TaxID=1524460 RepID=UPI003BA9ADCC